MKWRILLPLCMALIFFGVTVMEENDVDVAEITDIAITDGGDIFVLQKTENEARLGLIAQGSEWKIVKLDEQGNILNQFIFKHSPKGRFQRHLRLEVSKEGGVYVHTAEYDAETYYLTRESVGYLSEDMSVYTDILSFDYLATGEEIEYEKVLSMNELEGKLYIYRASDDSHERANVYLFDPITNTTALMYKITLQDKRKIDELLVTGEDTYMFRTMTGEVFSNVKDETPTKVYPIGAEALAVNLRFNESFGIYYYDPIKDALIQIHSDSLKVAINKDFSKLSSSVSTGKQIAGIYMNGIGDLAAFTLSTEDDGVELDLLIDGENYRVKHLKNDWATVRRASLISGFYGLLLGVCFVLVFIAYRRITAKRKPILYKFMVVFVPMMLLMSYILWTQTDRLFGKMAEDDLYAELHHLAILKAEQISVDKLKAMDSSLDYGTSEYIALEEEKNIEISNFNEIKASAYERWVYSALYRKIGDRLYVAVSDLKTMLPADFIYNEEAYNIYAKAFEQGEIVVGKESDNKGDWLIALAPILDTDGTLIGILEVGTGEATYAHYLAQQNRRILLINLSSVMIILIVLTVFIMRLLGPLKILTDSVAKVAQGEWGTVIHVSSNDEIGILAKLFNQMSVSIAEHIDYMQRLNEKYFKFVPQKFFDLLGKDNILEVELGDQVHQSMALVFMNLRDFFKTSVEMSPHESLNYINEAYRIFGKSISEHNGTIGAFRDSGQVGLFESMDSALLSAIKASEVVRKENAASDLSMESGICVHKGSVLIGVVGEENRMATSVMSDQVNHTVVLESFAAACGSCVILTQTAYDDLETPEIYRMRFLGHVRLKGLEEAVGIYDVFEADTINIRQMKSVSKAYFEAGVKYFENNRIDDARKAFIQVLRMNRNDPAAHMYLMKCEKLLESKQVVQSPHVLVDLSQEIG